MHLIKLYVKAALSIKYVLGYNTNYIYCSWHSKFLQSFDTHFIAERKHLTDH